MAPRVLTKQLVTRTSPKQLSKLQALERKTGLDQSQLIRYAIWKLPDPRTMTGDDIADLVVTVTGQLPGEIR